MKDRIEHRPLDARFGSNEQAPSRALVFQVATVGFSPASITSAVLRQRAISAGRLSIIAFQTALASS
jgi:hypothetical protein